MMDAGRPAEHAMQFGHLAHACGRRQSAAGGGSRVGAWMAAAAEKL